MTAINAHPDFLSIPLAGMDYTSLETERLPQQKGTYVLLMHIAKPHQLTVGRLGQHRFAQGWYAYVGSAFGPGGLRARLRHHLRRSAAPRWHIDYLTRMVVPSEVWVSVNPKRWEHSIAQWLQGLNDSGIPVPGFGCSDCRCRSHLFRFKNKPAPCFKSSAFLSMPAD